MSQWVTNSVILGMGRQGTLIRLQLLEAACALASSLVAAYFFGLIGVCVALGVNATMFRGVLQWYFGVRLLEVSPSRYVAQVILPPIAICCGLVAAFWLFGGAQGISGWTPFVLALLAYSALYWLTFWILLRLGLIRLHG